MPVSGAHPELAGDVLGHFVLYGMTALFLFRYFLVRSSPRKAAVIAIIISSLYGAALEGVQYFLPYRSFSLKDIYANSSGAFVVCVLYLRIYARRKARGTEQ
jgi:VanZ family protein